MSTSLKYSKNCYDVSPYDLKNAQLKINKQKKYLSSNTFTTKNGSVKTLFDVSMSANISSRYYAQLINKVNTLQQVMLNEDLVPVFLTITLDGVYHDLLFGNYSRISDADIEKLPKSIRFNELRQKAEKKETFSVNDLYQFLRFQWHSFQNSRVYKTIKKSYNIGYLFSVEPHTSGVPHAHVLLYVPYASIQALKNQFILSCPARLNITQNKSRLSPEQVSNGELNGFQWTISSPVGYILKYVTKSFMNLKNQSEIDELQAWYIKHRIVRFTTSHTLVPQWVYNKIYPLEKDWLYLTDLKNKGTCEWSREDDYFKLEDYNLDKSFIYNRGLYQLFVNGELIRQFGTYKEKEDFSFRYKDKFIIRSKKERLKIFIVINGIKYDIHDKPISKRCDWELYNYYNTLNIETCNLQHFGLLQNELIKRRLLKGDISPINSFSTEIVIKNVNPYAEEFIKARTYYSSMDAVNSLVSLRNVFSKFS